MSQRIRGNVGQRSRGENGAGHSPVDGNDHGNLSGTDKARHFVDDHWAAGRCLNTYTHPQYSER